MFTIMRRIMITKWIYLVLSLNHKIYGQNIEDNLISRLLTNYNRMARPITDTQLPVQVNLRFALVNLDNLDAKRQILETSGWIYMRWFDPRFVWSKEEYQGLDAVIIPPDKAWLPDVALHNAIGLMFQEDHYKYFYVRVYHTGMVEWVPGGYYHSKCDVDIRLFPFDDQVCELLFASWMYSDRALQFTLVSDTLNLEVYRPNMEWELVNGSVYIDSQGYTSLNGNEHVSLTNYSQVNVRLHLRRQPLYFIINILIPCIFLSCMILLVFWVPLDSGERIAMGITILLAFSVFSLTIAEKIPRASTAVPIISIYLMFFMAASCLAVAESVFVGYLHNQDIHTPPPAWLRHLVMKYIVLPAGSVKKKSTRQKSLQMEEHVETETELPQVNGEISSWIKQTNDNILNIKKELIQGKLIENDVTTQWKTIARIIDRFCFRSFLIIIVILTVMILGLLPLLKSTY